MNEIHINGCQPQPLASYLKALGVLRILGSHYPELRFYWSEGNFAIQLDADTPEILDFLVNHFEPTPIVAPWNGGSGFYPSDNSASLQRILGSSLPRLEPFRQTITEAQKNLAALKLDAKPDPATKEILLRACRNTFPEAALDWLDAVFVMTDGGPKYPPLLGTGGNDGRLEFTNNFMQRIVEVLGLGKKTDAAMSAQWLESSLFGTPVPSLMKSPIGQFNPGNAGGANATTGFDSDSLINPWDYILMIEGALLFAGAAVKRLNSQQGDSLAYPFCVRQSGSGYGTAAYSDESESRAEMWMPLWETPASLHEIESLFSEGRAEIDGKPAANGIDFTRAVVSLGVDRGITEFQRYGFLVRNGLAYFATPLDRVRVSRNPDADLIAELDGWLTVFRRKATQDTPSPPSSTTRALRRIEDGIIRFCKLPEPANAQSLLLALGAGEKSLGTSSRWAKANYLKPLGGLSPRWLEIADDHSPEFRLAASLASMVSRAGKRWFPLRMHLEAVATSKTAVFWEENASRDVVWHEGNLPEMMNRIFQRRLLHQAKVDEKDVLHLSKIHADLDDIARFIEGRVDDQKLADLLWGMLLIDWSQPFEAYPRLQPEGRGFAPPSMFALLRSCYPRRYNAKTSDEPAIPVSPIIHRRAADNRGEEASRLAARRLRASGRRPAIDRIAFDRTERIAAALLFPLSSRNEQKLLDIIQTRERDRFDAESTETTEQLIETV